MLQAAKSRKGQAFSGKTEERDNRKKTKSRESEGA